MILFISGGCKNGKSYYAQKRAKELAAGGPLYYVATMIPHDDEDRARIRRHLSERDGWGFETIERGRDIPGILADPRVDPGGTFLLDSITAVMENEMFPVELRDGEIVFEGEDAQAPARVKAELSDFAEAVRRAGGSVVFVSDGIYTDIEDYSSSTERYRRALAEADREVARLCDSVVEIAYGQVEEWK